MNSLTVVVFVCIFGFALSQSGCTVDIDCDPCSPPGEPHCHNDGVCYCEVPTECIEPKDQKSCRHISCDNGKTSICKKDGAHFHCTCSSQSGCTADINCDPCSPPGEPHCHSDGVCYCEVPTECIGPKDQKSCKHISCDNGKTSICKKDGAHFHCTC